MRLEQRFCAYAPLTTYEASHKINSKEGTVGALMIILMITERFA